MGIFMVMWIRSDDTRSLCFTTDEKPAVYYDETSAYVRWGQLREEFPNNHYEVVPAKVLP